MAYLPLTVLGGVAQAGGFGLTFYELARTQRREFPDYVPMHHQASRWIRRRMGLTKPKAVNVALAPAVASSSASLGLEVERAPATTLTARVDRLEKLIEDLRRKQREDHSKLEQRVAEASHRITETATAAQIQLNELEARRKESLRESLLFEKLGVSLFVVGTLLSVLGSSL